MRNNPTRRISVKPKIKYPKARVTPKQNSLKGMFRGKLQYQTLASKASHGTMAAPKKTAPTPYIKRLNINCPNVIKSHLTFSLLFIKFPETIPGLNRSSLFYSSG